MQNYSKSLVKTVQNAFLIRLKKATSIKNFTTQLDTIVNNPVMGSEQFFKESKYTTEPENIMANKVALVTGAASELGVLCTKELLRSGIKAVMIADSDEEEGRELLSEMCEEHGADKAAFIKTDLTNVRLLRNAFHSTESHFDQIDIVINISKEIEDAPWAEQIDINLKGLVRSTLLGYEYMGWHNGGPGGFIINVINTSSLDDNKVHPIAVGTKHYLTKFGKAMTERYYDETGVKIISAMCNPMLCSASEETLTKPIYKKDKELKFHGRTFPEMLKTSEPGSVWKLQCLNSPLRGEEKMDFSRLTNSNE